MAEPIYWAALAAYAINAIYRWRAKGLLNPGKDIVVATTALCWYVGIVAFNSDYAFTVTNVIIHGVPYLALIYWYGRARLEKSEGRGPFRLFARGPVLFLLILWALAYAKSCFGIEACGTSAIIMFGDGWAFASLKW